VYQYLAGYHKRTQLEHHLETKRSEVESFGALLPVGINKNIPPVKSITGKENPALLAFSPELRPDIENKIDNFFRAKDEVSSLEAKIKAFVTADNKVSFRDIDSLLKKLGAPMTKRQIEHMIWEVDERGDGVVCWDEFQLTYYRNIKDSTGSEPLSLFALVEFLIFDELHKGYIIEDDCMEILFARHGSAGLEKSLQTIFGNKLRAAGGDGTLDLSGFFLSVEKTVGKRALLT